MGDGSIIGLAFLGTILAGMGLLLLGRSKASRTIMLGSLTAIPLAFAVAITLRELL